jgi:integrase/recombinase XerD
MNWSAKTITHKTEKRIAVCFEKNTALIARIKQIEGLRWSQSLQVWHVQATFENKVRFRIEAIPPKDTPM